MKTFRLDAISPLDGRYFEKIEELSHLLSEKALITTRFEIEVRYLIALSESGVVREITSSEKKYLLSLFNLKDAEVIKIKKIEDTTRHDVKSVEIYLRDILERSSLEDLVESIHFGLTSEDINNLSYRLMLQRAVGRVIVPTLDKVLKDLVKKAEKYQKLPMLARTHGQPAVPTTLGKEIVNFAVRLIKQLQQLKNSKLTGKLNGAVGNYNALVFAYPKMDWTKFSKKFVGSLELIPNLFTTQINPYEDAIEVFQIIQRINGILLDLNQDFWRYISDEWFIQEVKTDEVGSSTMPQKVNPIDFENSEGNLILANGTFETISRKLAVSRLQRDLSDSTVVRNIGVGLGHSLLAYKSLLTGLSRISVNEKKITEALKDNFAILTEGTQTILRREKIRDAYNLIKGLSRGQKINQTQWREWIDKLPIALKVKMELENLSPAKYIGEAVSLTEEGIKEIKKLI